MDLSPIRPLSVLVARHSVHIQESFVLKNLSRTLLLKRVEGLDALCVVACSKVSVLLRLQGF